MNGKIVGLGMFVGIFVLGLGYLLLTSSDETANNASPATNTNPQQELPQQTKTADSNATESNLKATTNNPGVYSEYSEQALASAEGQPVLFFHAPWCFQCREIEEDILTDGVPAGYTVLKVDYDSNQELRNKYGIRLQTSFVKVDTSGQAVAENYVAYNEPSLAAVARDYLN